MASPRVGVVVANESKMVLLKANWYYRKIKDGLESNEDRVAGVVCWTKESIKNA
jgi:hypothetical protein